jgi:hypothetical protein
MIDIDFYIKVHELKYQLLGGERMPREFLMEKLESYRSK